MMFWRAKPTIDTEDLNWQIECWSWLLNNLGGTDELAQYRTLVPSNSDFPKSGKSNQAHAKFVFQQVAAYFKLAADEFSLVEQEQEIDPTLGPMAVVQGAPISPLGTYSTDQSAVHQITYSPVILDNLETLIATFAHEICHPILLGIPIAPPGEPEAEEFATDLATVFFGFGIFGGNTSFQFEQYSDSSTGTQGWAAKRAGYLNQNEWGFAIAVRAHLLGEDIRAFKKFCSNGLYANITKNFRFLENNTNYIESLKTNQFSTQ